MTMATNNHSYVFEGNLEMKDAGLVAADAAAQVDSADKIVDLGAAYVKGALVIDISAIEIASNDERYDICFQLSSSSTFASSVFNRAILAVGALETLIGGDTDTAVGRYILHVDNEFGGTIYRYARVYTNVTGSIATGINYTAYLSLG